MLRTAFVGVIVLGIGALCTTAEPPSSDTQKRRADAEELAKVARRGLELVLRPAPDNRERYTGVALWSKRVLWAELDLADNAQGRVAAWERHLARMIKLEQVASRLREQGVLVDVDLLEVEFLRQEAEVQLDRERDRTTPPPSAKKK